MSYTDLATIIDHAQIGSGYTRSATTIRSKSIQDNLHRKGWTKKYLKTALHNLDDTLLSGWPEEMFQEMFVKETAQVLETLDASLEHIGVNASRRREAMGVIAPFENESYTHTQLLEIAIDYLLGRYNPIASPTASYFAYSAQINEWIPYQKKEIMNLPYSCSYEIIRRFSNRINGLISELGGPRWKGKIFFHTTSWGGSVHIMNSIRRDKGRTCLDFGYKPAFYVSETVDDAIDWGVKKAQLWKNEVAIVVFCVPSDFTESFDYINLSGRYNEWRHIVKMFRDCVETPDMIDYDDKHDFIYGPMLANPLYYTSEGPVAHRPPVMQLAAKTDAATKYLFGCMKGAFIFRKN